MAKIFIKTLCLSALMMFLLFVSSGLPKVNGQTSCPELVGEGAENTCSEGSSYIPCDVSCKLLFTITHVGLCKPEDNGLHCHCYIPC
uniref:Defensin-like protein n=1 Tax=Brassica oleracea var. oleracea TaxID=109376 RepID=A0A0D3EER0_BRAOL